MTYSTIYTLDTRSHQWTVTHLFEHLLINRFYANLERKGVPTYLIGWIQGEVFEERMFIESDIYDEEIAKQFTNYLDNIPSFNNQEIAKAIKTLESEDKTDISILDINALKGELNTLRRLSWDINLQTDKSTPLIVLKETPASKKYRDLTVVVKTEPLTHSEQVLFLRLQAIIESMIYKILSNEPHLYSRGSSDLVLKDNRMAFLSIYTARRGTVTTKHITNLLIDEFKVIDVAALMPYFATYFHAYTAQPDSKRSIIQYYRATKILTSLEEIQMLATKKNLTSIFSKISFDVRPSSSADYSYVNL